MIEDEKISGDRSGGSRDFFQLAAPDKGRGIRTVAMLQKFAGYIGSRAGGQSS